MLKRFCCSVSSQVSKNSKKAQVRRLLEDLKSTRNLQKGKELHARASETGHDSSLHVATALVKMYAKCGSMVSAREVFDSLREPDMKAWTALILGYAENGEGSTALRLFTNMTSQAVPQDSLTFVAALKACSSLAVEQEGTRKIKCLDQGRQIHFLIGDHLNVYVQNSLIVMYAKCGSMVEARRVFEDMKEPTLVSWNTLIMGYSENGDGRTALKLRERMKSQGCEPNSITFLASLKACISIANNGHGKAECLQQGKTIHSEIGSQLSTYVQCTLMRMYAKCGSMVEAQQVFDCIKKPDLVQWTALILGYAENGQAMVALNLFERMKCQGCTPDPIAYVAALKACTALSLEKNGKEECLSRGKQIHSEIRSLSHVYVRSTLIDMYAKGGNMDEARKVFDSMKCTNVVCWNNMILGYVDNGDGATALNFYTRMKSQGCAPDTVTFVGALKACSLLGAFEPGSKIHGEINPADLDNAFLVTTLVDFYAKCGYMVKAKVFFDSKVTKRDLTTWTALLAGYSRIGDSNGVFETFDEMQDAGFQPNALTFACILTCCSHAGLDLKANEIFEAMPIRYGVNPNLEHYNCMVDILGRSNKLNDAIALLRNMPFRPDAVAWTTLLGACYKCKNVGTAKLAFESLVRIEASHSRAYVLMANIFGKRGFWREQRAVLEMREKVHVLRTPVESCWTNDDGKVHLL